MFRGRDGVVRFTDGGTPVSCRPSDGGLEVTMQATARGGPVTVRAETLVSDSDAVLPAVLSFGGRAGGLASTLRVRGRPATLSPHDDLPLMEAMELRVAGSLPRILPLPKALEALGIEWSPVDGGAEAFATQPTGRWDGGAAGEAHYDDTL
eukprot:4230270-Pleurochrysis_carterae.AAC.1